MNTKVPVKSILKQKTPSKSAAEAVDEAKLQADKDKRNREIALQYAHRIQNRKDAEKTILDNIVTLIDLPSKPDSFDGSDAVTFIRLIGPFQPSDYDSLIEERRVDGRCAYTLCGRAPRREHLTMQLTPGAANWCSNACARKGIYVKSQLSSIPVWERPSNLRLDIRLFQDDQEKLEAYLKTPEASAVRRANRAAKVDDWRNEVESQSQQSALANERGESVHSFRPGQILSEGIIEKKVTKIESCYLQKNIILRHIGMSRQDT